MACFYTFTILVVGIYLYARASEHTRKQRRLQAARGRYQRALAALDHDPSNLDSRKEALAAGRFLAETARSMAGHGGRAIFDEVELQNDLAIRIGVAPGTTGSVVRQESKAARSSKCPHCGARIDAGATACSYCGTAISRS